MKRIISLILACLMMTLIPMTVQGKEVYEDFVEFGTSEYDTIYMMLHSTVPNGQDGVGYLTAEDFPYLDVERIDFFHGPVWVAIRLKDKDGRDIYDEIKKIFENPPEIENGYIKAIGPEAVDEEGCLSDKFENATELYNRLFGITPGGGEGSGTSTHYWPHESTLDSSSVFDDVGEKAWFRKSVDFVYTLNFMNGMSDKTFAPNVSTSRAMLVTVLWRVEGSPIPGKTAGFTDLKAGWYRDAVAWAYENSIVKGMSDTTFAPNNSITREQIAAIFYRYAEFKGEDVTKRDDITKFPDGSKVSQYAKEAMSWAVAEGLISGTKVGGKDYLDPKGNATRAQVATILMRYLTSFDDPSGTVHGVSTDNTVTLGWMINALYELEGKPEVTDWSPFDGHYEMDIYDPEKAAEWDFWNITVKEEWYYKPLMWAIENKLYVPFNHSIVIGDFANSAAYKWKIVDLIAEYSEKFGIELPKVKDYPGFDDLDELDNSNPNIIKVYEAGLITESESGKLGLYDGEFTLDEAESIMGKITALRNGN